MLQLSQKEELLVLPELSIIGTDHIELYVSNAKQAARFYENVLGFEIFAYTGPEYGTKDEVAYALRQSKIILVLRSSLRAETAISKHVMKHGDSVKAIGLTVDDAKLSYEGCIQKGAVSVQVPTTLEDEFGTIVTASISTYGDTIHTFVERKNYKGTYFPKFQPYTLNTFTGSVGLIHIDHCVGNVELGEMNKWVKFYEEVMGFKLLLTFDDEDISTEYSALMSKVVSNGNGYIKFPINEPAQGKRKSQIEEYLDFHNGPGVQHIATATYDIVSTVTALRNRGVEFLEVPDSYYEELKQRIGIIDEDIEVLKNLNILVDRDDEGYLLQIFTKPIVDRPTLFLEIIQRKGATSFGKGNFKALFEAIEREQARRGNL
jgi:4-hydroxyphenylpyruvate dioxygenase